ncbi:MAG TPA: hypothetical protein VKU00_13860 [Chthonomonadaceae bacterium]|nr:hypothetical protein [Chthonomonadaceae bacterium]
MKGQNGTHCHSVQRVGYKHDVTSGSVTSYWLKRTELPKIGKTIGELKLTSDGQAFATDWDSYIHFYSWDDQKTDDRKPRMDFVSWSLNHPIEEPHHWTLHGPVDTFVYDIKVSPDGKHIVWILESHGKDPWQAFLHRFIPRISGSDRHRWEIWVSDTDGSHMRQIGYEELPNPGDYSSVPMDLQWLPDGKHLSFLHKETLYTLGL